jgi:multicomponent Na+:H+ antiporter subunit A
VQAILVGRTPTEEKQGVREPRPIRETSNLIAVLVIHALVAGATVAFGRRLGRRVMLLGALGPAAAIIWLATAWNGMRNSGPVVEQFTWAPAIGLDGTFRLDGFSALMVGLVGGIGTLVFVYAWRYFDDREGLGRFASYLVAFAGSMFGLVTADNLLLLFVFWELTSVTSYLLIGFDDESPTARAGALQALLVTGIGGLVMLAGLVLLAQDAGTYTLSAILASPPSSTAAGVGLVLILVGAFTKSAQVPFHFWLPGAMTAPTPVSAYLHSATMVKAGIYLIARLAPVFAPLFVWWSPLLVTVGLATMLVGGWRALAQHDLKLLLAQGTVSQLGFIVVLVGIGIPELTFAGMAMILGHAIFKAALFMIAGIVDHQTHTRDMRRLTGLMTAMPATAVLAAIAAASMAGLPPLLGFVTKEAALEGLVHAGNPWITGGVVVGSALTVAYGLRFIWSGFTTKADDDVTDPVGPDAPAPSASFMFAPAVLVAVTVVAGFLPRLVDETVATAATALDQGAEVYHLALWHGFSLPLALSALAVAAGWLVWKRPLTRLRSLTQRVPAGSAVYSASVNGLHRSAEGLTSIVQSGSLPVYLGVILTTAVVVPGVLLAQHWTLPTELALTESPIQAAAALGVVAAAFGAARMRRRLAAVLLLGAVGYGVAILFVIQGAPDLALTQLLIETLFLALFVLVLKRLPDNFETLQWRLAQTTRIAVATGVALTAGAFALWATAGRVAPPGIEEFMARAEPEGGGRNVVNVILTDFRALDTLGEITVLAVAALGVMALVKAKIKPEDKVES